VCQQRLKKFAAQKGFYFFPSFALKQLRRKNSVREKLCVNFEHKSAWSITAVITYGWIFLASCLVFTFFV
jgi:hypothetical protein